MINRTGTRIRIAGFALAAIAMFAACENNLLETIETDVFRATSEKFAEVTLRKGLSIIEQDVVFNGTVVGSSRNLTLTILNSGEFTMTLTPFSISGDHAGDFAIATDPNRAVLEPNEEVTFSLRFSPTASGDRTATLEIAFDGGAEESARYTLNGNAAGVDEPEIEVVDFNNEIVAYVNGGAVPTVEANASVRTGTTEDYVFTVSSVTPENVDVSSGVDFVDDPGTTTDSYFALVGATDLSSPLTNGADQTFTIRFSPPLGATEEAVSATFEIANNDPNESNFRFTIVSYITEPDLAVFTSSSRATPVPDGTGTVDFPLARSGGDSVNASVYLYNEARVYAGKTNTAGALSINSITDGSALFSNSSVTTIGAGSGRTLSLVFNPATLSAGAHAASTTLTIDTDMQIPLSESDWTIALRAEADTPDISIDYSYKGGSATDIADGSTIFIDGGGSASREPLTVTINNDGGFPLTVNAPTWRRTKTGLLNELGENGAFRIIGSTNIDLGRNPSNVFNSKPARFDIVWSGEASSLYYTERIEIYSDDPDEPVLSFDVVTGNPQLVSVGYTEVENQPFPAIWLINPNGGADATVSTAYLPEGKTQGELFDAVLIDPSEGVIRAYGTFAFEGDQYEAGHIDFSVLARRYLTDAPVRNNLIRERVEGAPSVVHGASIYGSVFHVAGASRDGYVPNDPGSNNWWAMEVQRGFLGRGTPGKLDAVEPVQNSSAPLDAVNGFPYFDMSGFAPGTFGNSNSTIWRGARADDLLELADNAVAFGAATASDYAIFTGASGDDARVWTWDKASENVDGDVTLPSLGGSSIAFAVAEVGRRTVSVAGISNTTPVVWTDLGGANQLGANKGTAFDIINAQGTLIAVGETGRPTVWDNAGGSETEVLTAETTGRMNGVINLVPWTTY